VIFLVKNLPLCRKKILFLLSIRNYTKRRKKKIYSIHEPQVVRTSKGKEHKKYEFGNKVSIAKTDSGVIIGVLSFRGE